MDKILSMQKRVEYKEYSEFWQKRLDPLLRCYDKICINFLCGQKSYKFEVMYLERIKVQWAIDIDGKICHEYYAIYIGEKIN